MDRSPAPRCSPEPLTAHPPRPLRRLLFTQFWRDVVFLHWTVAPAAVAHLMPAGTRPDTLDGLTRVGLVGFRMERLGLGGGPPMPYLGTFPEVNVRLYSVDRLGRRGVVFLSLDCSRLLPVLAARAAFGLPYRWARCRAGASPSRVAYTVRPLGWTGRAARAADSSFAVAPDTGNPLPHGPSRARADFDTARWGLHVRAKGRTWFLPNRHPPWPLYQARLLGCEGDLPGRAGLPGVSGPPDDVLYSPGVAVRFGFPERLPGS